jgi:hypothetical protein
MIILLFALFFTSCNTVNTHKIAAVHPNTVLNTSNYASNIYIGISGRMTIHEKEIEYAKLHIAHQIAIRDKCIVDEGNIFMYGNHYDYIISDSNFDYNDSYIDEIINQIEIIETHIFKDLVVAIGKDSQKQAAANTPVPRKNQERPVWLRNPEWVRRLPGLEGYMVGVGVSDRYSFFYRGILVADVRAAQAIAAEKSAYSRNYSSDQADNYTANMDVGNIALTQAELNGFYILDRWIEPDGSQCYSLGVARKF